MTNKPPIRIYANEIKNRITFKIKIKYYLELLIPEKLKLLRSSKNKIIKNKCCEIVPKLEITGVLLLVHCNTVNNIYEHGS